MSVSQPMAQRTSLYRAGNAPDAPTWSTGVRPGAEASEAHAKIANTVSLPRVPEWLSLSERVCLRRFYPNFWGSHRPSAQSQTRGLSERLYSNAARSRFYCSFPRGRSSSPNVLFLRAAAATFQPCVAEERDTRFEANRRSSCRSAQWLLTELALKCVPSIDFGGYYQRHLDSHQL